MSGPNRYFDRSTGKTDVQEGSDGRGHVLYQNTPPAEAQYNKQIVGTTSSKYSLLSGTTFNSGIIDLRDLSELRSFWIEFGAGSGTVTVTATPCANSLGTIQGDDQTLGTSLAVSTILDLPLATLPYAPYYIFNFAETATADIDIYAFLLGRGGA